MTTTLDLLRGVGGLTREGDGAAVFTSTAAPVQFDGPTLGLLLALALVASIVGGLAALVWERIRRT